MNLRESYINYFLLILLIFHTCYENNCIKFTNILRFDFGEHGVLPFIYDLALILTSKRGIVSFFFFINQNNIFKRTDFFTTDKWTKNNLVSLLKNKERDCKSNTCFEFNELHLKPILGEIHRKFKRCQGHLNS